MTLRERLKALRESRAGRRAARVALDPEVRDAMRDAGDALRSALEDGKIDAEELATIAKAIGDLRDTLRAVSQRAGGVS